MADTVFDQAGSRPLTEDIRSRLAGRAAALRFETIKPYLASLERDPVHPATFYAAVDAQDGQALLLHMAPASAPASGLFPKSLLLARVRSAADREVVVNAIPFSPAHGEHVRIYAERVNTAFLPRPSGSQPAVIVCGGRPEVVMPGAFEAFRAILKRTGRKVAALAGNVETALWAAIRAGWREGFNLEAETWPAPAICSRFRGRMPLEEAASLYDAARQARVASPYGRSFDFELVMPEDRPTAAEQLHEALEWFKERGCPVQAVAVAVGAAEDAAALAAIARQYQAILSLRTAAGVRANLRLEFSPEDSRDEVVDRVTAAAELING